MHKLKGSTSLTMIMKEGKKNGNTLNMQNIIDDETEKKN